MKMRETIFFLCFALAIVSGAAAAGEKPYFKVEPVFQYDESHPENHSSSLAEMPNGDLLATWFAGSSEGLPDVALWSSRKPAGSNEWTKPAPLVDEPGRPEGNSVLFTDSKGKVWLFFVRKYDPKWDAWDKTKIFLQTSRDSGYTWTEPRVLEERLGWIIRNGVLELPGGRLLLPVYTDAEPKRSLMWISGDGFKTWEQRDVPVTIPGNIQPAFVHTGGDTLLMFARHYTVPGKIFFARSEDMGKTWTKPKKMKFKNPDSGIDAIGLKSGAIVLAYDDSMLVRWPLCIAMSEDKGKTWPFNKTIETEYMEFSYPYLIQTKDGLIHMIYTAYDRQFLKHAVFNEAWLKSKE
jgi:predicted neuraminidase